MAQGGPGYLWIMPDVRAETCKRLHETDGIGHMQNRRCMGPDV